MEIDSNYESSNLVDFPKIMRNSINTINSINSIQTNSLYHNKDIQNNYNINNAKINNIQKIKIENKKLLLAKRKKVNDELLSLIAQKISKNKINYMNYDKLTDAIIQYKKAGKSNTSDPIIKYFNNFTAFYPIKIKKEDLSSEFLRLNKDFLQDIEKLNLKKKKKENEKFLNFKKENFKFNIHNYFLSRMNNIEKRNKSKSKEENIILIQKHVRGLLFRANLNKEISKLVIIFIMEKILKIQKAVKLFLKRKKNKTNIIIKIIKRERKEKANKIIDMLSMYHLRNQYKKYLLIQKILYQRIESSKIICRAILNFNFRKKIKKIRELRNNNFEIIYPAKNKKDIKLKIYYNNNISKEFKFDFCEIRKTFVLYIKKEMIENNSHKNEYLCHFFVDNKCVIDKRFKIIKNKFGVIYNLIEFKNKDKINAYTDIKKNINIKKFENIEMNTIPYNNNSSFITTPPINNSNYLYNTQKLKENYYNSFLNNSTHLNVKKESDIFEKRKIKRYKNRSTFSDLHLKNINIQNNKNINPYEDSFTDDINNMNNTYLYNNYGNKNKIKFYPYYYSTINEEINDNALLNSSSTISNSNTFRKEINNTYKNSDNKKNKIIIEESNVTNKFNKNITKKKKSFPIFY